MDTKIYFIIGGIAVAFIIYAIVLNVIMKKRKEKQLNNFDSNHSGNPLTEQQKRLLTFGAILFHYKNEKILDIKPETHLDQYIHGLKHQWEISNSEEAKETIGDLLALKRSTEFRPALQQSSPELSKIQRRIAKTLRLELSEVEQTRSAYAWDICRAVSLAKWCYWCGYLTENEAWDIIEKASKIAGQQGKNWTEYTVSFLLGRTIQGFDLDDLDIQCQELLHSKRPSLREIDDIDVYKRYSFV